MTIRAGVGSSTKKNVDEAAREAYNKMTKGLGGGKANLMVCFSSVSYDQDKLINNLGRMQKDVPLVGLDYFHVFYSQHQRFNHQSRSLRPV